MGVSPINTLVPALPAGASTTLAVQMTSPDEAGIYESQWRLATPTGVFFGDPIWSIVTVEPSGTMALTQQLSNLNCQSLVHSTSPPPPPRPTSPTDAQLTVVNSRSVLSRRMVGLETPQSMDAMEDEDDMN